MVIRSASVLVRDGRGRVLLVLRGEGPNQGRWSLPGGKSEAGESPAQTAAREMAEETGLSVRPDAELEVVEVGAGDDSYEIHVFVATVLGGELAAADDAADARWTTMERLAALPVTPGLVELITRHPAP